MTTESFNLLQDINDFLEAVYEIRDGGCGSHWPEYVWHDMYGAAVSAVEELKRRNGQSSNALR